MPVSSLTGVTKTRYTHVERWVQTLTLHQIQQNIKLEIVTLLEEDIGESL